MGRKKNLNPMDAYRRKQKKAQIAKNKKKRTEAKEKALKHRSAEWIMAEIQKLNRRGIVSYSYSNPCAILQTINNTEQQDRGKNEEKYTNRRTKLTEAYNRAIRIQKIKEKTQQIKEANDPNLANKESSPTPPPIEGLEEESKNESNPSKHIQPILPIPNPLYGHLYPINPLMMPNHYGPSGMNTIYSNTFDANSNSRNNQMPTHSYPKQQRRQRDIFDPMNPANPKYNFIHDRNNNNQNYQILPTSVDRQMDNQIIDKPEIVHKPQPIAKKQDEDITKMKKPKHEIEVIMDPKLKMLRPSSMRFKRKFDKPKIVRAAKKRKLDIAPDVDKEQSVKNVKKSNVNKNNNFVSGNADAAYDKFMNEIESLI